MRGVQCARKNTGQLQMLANATLTARYFIFSCCIVQVENYLTLPYLTNCIGKHDKKMLMLSNTEQRTSHVPQMLVNIREQ